MGQNSSRDRPPTYSTASASNNAGQSSAPSRTETNMDAQPTIAAPVSKSSRRSTIRKSILKFVKPSSGVSETPSESSSPKTDANATKRRWRSSSRFSRAPAITTINTAETLAPPVIVHAEEAPSVVIPEPVIQKDKGKEREDRSSDREQAEDNINNDAELLDDAASASTPVQCGSSPSVSGTSATEATDEVEDQTIPTIAIEPPQEDLIESVIDSQHHQHDTEDEVVISPESFRKAASETGTLRNEASVSTHTATDAGSPPESTQSPLAVSNETTSPTQNTGTMPFPSTFSHTAPTQPHPPPVAAQARQFPPPGTLVVVQGVVHTTDVPLSRPPQSDTIGQSNSQSTSYGDAPTLRPRAMSTPRPTTSTSALDRSRNRLSAFIPRSRPVSVVTNESGSGNGNGSSSGRPLSGLFGMGQGAGPSNEGTRTDGSTADVTESDANAASGSTGISQDASSNTNPRDAVGNTSAAGESGMRSEGDGRERRPEGPISSSSIDVLGTLLSVAAAATAASLLTGSSEPIFSSGLAPPGSQPTTLSTNTNASAGTEPSPSTRPMSPTPTAGLERDTGRERVRNAWGSFRERLGLRSAGATTTPNGGVGSEVPEGDEQGAPRAGGTTGRTPADAREAMLSEMARAFNLGLGLSNPASLPTDANSSASINTSGSAAEDASQGGSSTPRTSTSDRAPPAADSFERFLVDLQADLRIALSMNSGAEAAGSTEPEPEASTSSIPPEFPVQHTETPIARDEDSNNDDEDNEPPPLQDVSDFEDESDTDDNHNDEVDDIYSVESDMPELEPVDSSTLPSPTEEPSAPRPPLSSLPSLTALGTSTDTPLGSPTAGAAAAPPLSPEGSSPTSGSADGASTSRSGSSTSGTQRRPGGGINWWWLYRFPPITNPQAQAAPASQSPDAAVSQAQSVPAAQDPPPIPVASDPREPSTSRAFEPAPADPPPPAPTSNVVIPVIVVGLQSVNLSRRREARGEDLFTPEEQASPLGDDVDFGEFPPPPESDAGSQRGRPWRSRAADALRNLRPGRRDNQRGQRADATGSRTFLIYVIGGYYPPDHHIITSTNTLDSFEALWELADLLGQVKPPTATKEDIDKSGLEIIRSDKLQEYEKEGKVSANCLDRCLICLDDYDPEDDLRLLGCRHAFHKNCVDKWMLTGRNNCPACRSKGVSTDGESSTSQPAET